MLAQLKVTCEPRWKDITLLSLLMVKPQVVKHLHLSVHSLPCAFKRASLICTQTGNDTEPGIIPRAMRDVFGYIKKTPSREFLLRCSYLEIYNETIHDLLSHSGAPVGLQGT